MGLSTKELLYKRAERKDREIKKQENSARNCPCRGGQAQCARIRRSAALGTSERVCIRLPSPCAQSHLDAMRALRLSWIG